MYGWLLCWAQFVFCSDELPIDQRKFGIHIVIKIHACGFAIVQSGVSWVSCVRCSSGWEMVKQVGARGDYCPPFKFDRHGRSSIQVIRVYIPNKNQSNHFVFFHSCSLRFELEAVVVGMVTESHVHLPCQRVANLLIRKVSGNCFGGSIQSAVLNAYLGSVISMPFGWLPKGNGGPVPLEMVVRYNYRR